jgi:hypothetical protein
MARKSVSVPRSSGVVRPAVKVTARLSAPVSGSRMKKNMADEMGRHPCGNGESKH